MIGNVRVKEVRTETFLSLLQLSKMYRELGMRPATVMSPLREILVQAEESRAEKRLLARSDKQLYSWFRFSFLNTSVRAGVQKLGEELDETRRNRMAATLSVASLIVERGLMLGQVVPPVANEQVGVEAESVDEHTHKKRKVTHVTVVESPSRDIENWQPGRQSQEAAQPKVTSEKKLDEGEETEWRESQEVNK